MFRKLCEAYPGTTPRDYEKLTRDQLYVMMLPIKDLEGLAGTQTMNVRSAQLKGIIPDDKHLLGGYRSLAEKLNAEQAEKDKPSKKEMIARRRELQLQAKRRADNTV